MTRKPCGRGESLAALCSCLALMLATVGCGKWGLGGHDQGAAADDHHDHEVKTAQVTIWNNGYEVFAEYPAPAAGEATRLVVHVTDLQTFEPRRQGAVKVRARQGDATVEVVQPGPARPGIYLPDVTFTKPGEWQLTLIVPGEGGEAAVGLGTVTVHADDHAAAHAEVPEPPDGVGFLKEQQWNVGCRTEPAGRRRLVERERVAARVRARPGSSATVQAPVAGQWMAVPDVGLPEPGRKVAAGQVLGWIRPQSPEDAIRVASVESELATARAVLELAEAAYKRTEGLAAAQARSPRELQEAEAALRSAKARHDAAAAVRNALATTAERGTGDGAMRLELRAPIGGMLNSVQAGPGASVSAGQELFTVLDPATVWIEARIPEASVGRLGSAGEASVERVGDDSALVPITGPGRGRLVSLGLEVDTTTRTVPLIYETANAGGQLRVGQALTLHVETAVSKEALAIPYSALVEEGGVFVVFVQVAGEVFARRELMLGIRDGEWIEVLSGVKDGERVVTRGAYAVRLASASNALPAHGHGHSH